MKNIIVFLLLSLFFVTKVWADSMRCGRRLIQTGDHKLKVLQKCGEPEYADQRYGVTGSQFRYPRGTLQIDKYEQVLIDEWIYNFGPTKFKQFLRFENGILIDIQDMDYGN